MKIFQICLFKSSMINWPIWQIKLTQITCLFSNSRRQTEPVWRVIYITSEIICLNSSAVQKHCKCFWPPLINIGIENQKCHSALKCLLFTLLWRSLHLCGGSVRFLAASGNSFCPFLMIIALILLLCFFIIWGWCFKWAAIASFLVGFRLPTK